MSLINQVLQDLEKRRASATERGVLPNQVRVLPQHEASSLPWWLISVASAVALAILLGWQFSTSSAPAVQPPPPAVQSASPPAAAAGALSQVTGPVSRLALDLENIPSAASVNDAPVERAPEPAASQIVRAPAPPKAPLPTAAVIAVPSPAPRVSAAPAPKAEPARPAAPTAEHATTLTAAASASPATVPAAAKPVLASLRVTEALPENRTPTASAPPQIDKRAQTLTAQQLAESEYRDGANFLNQGRLADAQEAFRSALQHNPAHVSARQGLFGLLLDAKKNAEAEHLLQDGLKLNPNQPGFALALASLQYERGDVAGAIETMQKSGAAAQTNPDYLARLAGLLQRQARHKEAVENYQAALRVAPGSGVWLMGLGISLQALGRNGEAQEAFRRAKATNTLNPELVAFVDQRLKQLP